jgi:hypothetical protein
MAEPALPGVLRNAGRVGDCRMMFGRVHVLLVAVVVRSIWIWIWRLAISYFQRWLMITIMTITTRPLRGCSETLFLTIKKHLFLSAALGILTLWLL